MRGIDGIVNFAVLVTLLLLLLFGCYSLWDSKQVYSAASANQFEIYKPSSEEAQLSLEDLQAINPDVCGWLTVYGTGIDYPFVQGEDDWEYLNRAADGSYNLAGSIFLSSYNRKDFSDYNTILHGHHMDASAMFGDLTKFNDRTFFDAHRYGNLFVNGRDYGIVFFAYLVADAYDSEIYARPISDPEAQASYLSLLERSAVHLCQANQADAEHILLLSTCTSGITNGRGILVGYLTDQLYPDHFYEPPEVKELRKLDILAQWNEFTTIPLWIWMLILLVFLIFVYISYHIISKAIRTKRANQMLSRQKEGNFHEKNN